MVTKPKGNNNADTCLFLGLKVMLLEVLIAQSFLFIVILSLFPNPYVMIYVVFFQCEIQEEKFA